MKKILLAAILVCLLCTPAFAADVSGVWRGKIYPHGYTEIISFTLELNQHGYYANGFYSTPFGFDIPVRGTFSGNRLQLSTVDYDPNQSLGKIAFLVDLDLMYDKSGKRFAGLWHFVQDGGRYVQRFGMAKMRR